MMRSFAWIVALSGAVSPSSAAYAQIAPSIGVEAATDEVRRGLSWSGGRAAASADVSLDLAAFDASLRVATTRGSPRHAGADAVADLDIGYGFDLSALSLRASVLGHLFSGAGIRADYAELGATGSYTLGPVTLDAGARYAPDQAAIGGDNLYLFANLSGGVIGTPVTVNAGVGRSSGSIDDPIRAARLRPAGRYIDWRLGAAYVMSPLTLAVDYIGNDVDTARATSPLADAAHAGDRIVGRVRLAF